MDPSGIVGRSSSIASQGAMVSTPAGESRAGVFFSGWLL
jgi:hypothetical protein